MLAVVQLKRQEIVTLIEMWMQSIKLPFAPKEKEIQFFQVIFKRALGC